MGLILKPRVGLRPRWNNNPMAIPAPVAAWVMNEGSGNKAYDLSGNGLTGTLTAPDGDECIFKSGDIFFGAGGGWDDAVIICGTSDILNFTSDFSVVAKLLTPSDHTFGIFDRLDSGDFSGYALQHVVGAGIRYYSINTGWQVLASAILSTNIWHTVGLVVDIDVGGYGYIDGIQSGSWSDATSAPTSNSGATAKIGQDYNNASLVDGYFAYVYVYNCALTAAQNAYIHQYPYYAWEYPELWELYAAAAVGAEFELLVGAGGMDGGFLGGGLNPMTG